MDKIKKQVNQLANESVNKSKSRQLTPDSYSSKRLRRKALRTETRKTKLPNAFRILRQAGGIFFKHWEVFGGVLLIYALLNIVLIGGINGGGDLQAIKDGLGEVFTGQLGKLSTGLTLFTFLVTTGTGTTASGVASAYQTMLLVMVSLVLIWVFRQLYAGHTVRIRDGFYRGMHPLVPFIVVLFWIGLQLLPALTGAFLYQSLVSGGILTVLWHQVIACGVSFVLVGVTVYWLCSSLFALYVVTLPEMTPWAAIKSAKEIVKFRRANVLRKLLFLVVAIFILAALVMVPIALFATAAAIPVFFVLTVITVGLVHSYCYALYRELIA